MKETLTFDFTAKLTQMVRSQTWIRNDDEIGRPNWFAIGLSLLFCANIFQTGTAQTTTSNAFLVSSSTPYRLPNVIVTAPYDPSLSPMRGLSASQVGNLAAQRCGPANLLLTNESLRALQSPSICKGDEQTKEHINTFQKAVAWRLRQTAAANALKLHYGIAATLKVERLLAETLQTVAKQEEAQKQLIDKGVPIPDPTLVDRLRIGVEDKRLENQSKLTVLRTQLAALIGTENACSHSPDEPDEISPSDRNVCEYIEQSMGCRCDLISLQHSRGKINSETLDAWDSLGALLSGAPVIAKQRSFWTKLLRPIQNRADTESAIVTRRRWLDELIAERKKQIAMDIDVAFEKKRTAALRWVNASDQIATWELRLAQLESLSAVQGNLASQYEAQLSRRQIEGLKIERWVDWHLANVDLMLAVGCDL